MSFTEESAFGGMEEKCGGESPLGADFFLVRGTSKFLASVGTTPPPSTQKEKPLPFEQSAKKMVALLGYMIFLDNVMLITNATRNNLLTKPN